MGADEVTVSVDERTGKSVIIVREIIRHVCIEVWGPETKSHGWPPSSLLGPDLKRAR